MSIRMRHTRSHTKNRRSHHGLSKTATTVDSETGVTHMRHRASLQTGKYRGRQVCDVTAGAEKQFAQQNKEDNK